MGNRNPQHNANTFQKQPEHQCVINAALVTNPKRRKIWVAVRKINFFPQDPVYPQSFSSQSSTVPGASLSVCMDKSFAGL